MPEPQKRFRKTRLAPTPSGFLHNGNALSFLLTQELAGAYDAGILLRIDDMDRERVRPEYVADVFETLRWLGIDWQEGPHDAEDFEMRWSQRQRLPLYEKALAQLAANRSVFACTCSRTEILRMHPDGHYTGTCNNRQLPLDTPGAAWRMHTSAAEPLTVHLRDGGNVSATLPEAQSSFVVRKRDGLPAYQLSSVCDDLHFGVDLIVRGQDLWDSTLAQLYLARTLGAKSFLNTAFAHHPLLVDDGGEKLSKSAGARSIRGDRSPGQREALLERYRQWRSSFTV